MIKGLRKKSVYKIVKSWVNAGCQEEDEETILFEVKEDALWFAIDYEFKFIKDLFEAQEEGVKFNFSPISEQELDKFTVKKISNQTLMEFNNFLYLKSEEHGPGIMFPSLTFSKTFIYGKHK